MFCSVIIPTIGRESLNAAVDSVLEQELPGDLEVIVVNDSGAPLTPAGWQTDPRARVVDFNSGKSYGKARNHGAAMAAGRYLMFLDDDDRLYPGALAALRELTRTHPAAGIVYGTGVLADKSGRILGEINIGKTGNCFAEMIGGSWIQVGQCLIRTDLFQEAGAFDVAFTITEETHLQRLLALHTDFAHTGSPIVHILRGEGWVTAADYSGAIELNRISRERCLMEPGAYSRLAASAGGNAYWIGRITQAYLADARRQLGRMKLKRFALDLLCALRSVLLAGRLALAPDFRAALRDNHPPNSQARVLAAQPIGRKS